MGALLRTWRKNGQSLSDLLMQISEKFSEGLFGQLKETVETYVRAITPTEKEREEKRSIYNAFEEFIKESLHDRVQTLIVGSTAYDVDSKRSDLDIVLLTNWGTPNVVLQNIIDYFLQTQSYCKNSNDWPLKNIALQFVDSARVPLLMLTSPSGLVCDVSVNTMNSVRHTEYFKNLLVQNAQRRPLMRLVKYWTKTRKLPSMREGGLPSIVWIILASTYASCSKDSLVNFLCSKNNLAGFKNFDLLDKKVPLIGRLLRFFVVGSNRSNGVKHLILNKNCCIIKQDDNNNQKYYPITDQCGIWDEAISVEDPAYDRRENNSYHNFYNRDYFHEFDNENITSKDLAAKISCATWLVYLIEFHRALMILSRLISFLEDSCSRVRRLPQIILLNDNRFMLNRRTLNFIHYLNENSKNEKTSKAAQDYIAQVFRNSFGALFQENDLDRFLLPGCNEGLNKIVTEKNKSDANELSESALLDNQWGANLLTVRGVGNSVVHPFCTCCTDCQFNFALVLLHGRIHLVKIDSICTDWSTWWTRSFLSRRDVRSTIHGTLYTILTYEDYKDYINTTGFRNVALPATSFPALLLNSTNEFLFSDKRPAIPSILAPVKSTNNSKIFKIQFHPCHFICRIKTWQTPNYEDKEFSEFSKEIYFLEFDELAYIRQLISIAKNFSWYSFGDKIGLDTNLNEIERNFQKPPESCSKCSSLGNGLLNAHKKFGYVSAHGIFQPDLYVRRADFKNFLAEIWDRWKDHTLRTTKSHSKKSVLRKNQELASLSMIFKDFHIVPEMNKATQQVYIAIDAVKRSTKRIHKTDKLSFYLNRSNSAPPTLYRRNRTHVNAKTHDLILKVVEPNSKIINNDLSNIKPIVEKMQPINNNVEIYDIEKKLTDQIVYDISKERDLQAFRIFDPTNLEEPFDKNLPDNTLKNSCDQ